LRCFTSLVQNRYASETEFKFWETLERICLVSSFLLHSPVRSRGVRSAIAAAATSFPSLMRLLLFPRRRPAMVRPRRLPSHRLAPSLLPLPLPACILAPRTTTETWAKVLPEQRQSIRHLLPAIAPVARSGCSTMDNERCTRPRFMRVSRRSHTRDELSCRADCDGYGPARPEGATVT